MMASAAVHPGDIDKRAMASPEAPSAATLEPHTTVRVRRVTDPSGHWTDFEGGCDIAHIRDVFPTCAALKPASSVSDRWLTVNPALTAAAWHCTV